MAGRVCVHSENDWKTTGNTRRPYALASKHTQAATAQTNTKYSLTYMRYIKNCVNI